MHKRFQRQSNGWCVQWSRTLYYVKQDFNALFISLARDVTSVPATWGGGGCRTRVLTIKW